jgi:hypothetical protein
MNRATVAAGIMAAAMLAAAPETTMGESAVPNPGEFFQFTPEFDPQAGGTKYDGTMTIAYVFADDAAGCPDSERRIDNMHVVLTLTKGNEVRPFNADFVSTQTAPFCFLGESQQTQFVLNLIRNQVLPHFYGGCFPGSCPAFKVKSVSDFLSTGTGAISMKISIAVQ